ncbi:MAG: BMP family ABC transporter substrate-binding protein [Thaumarchaeota archaeon]|nr:BMP family ABC transporter substrate-binding protein [Nitrososphaerota archaeon]
MRKRAISNKTTITVIAVIIIIALAGIVYYYYYSGVGPAATKNKMAMIISGPVNDNDYEALGLQALQAVGKSTGITTAYSENVNPADLDTAVSQYVSQGFNIIWVHGAEFASAVGPGVSDNGTASKNPNIRFILETDVPPAQIRSNVWVIDRNYIPGMYAVGAAAALATHTGTIAYVGALKLPFSLAEANAIILAAHATNSSVKVLRYWTGDFFDPVKASSATQALVGQGADVIINSLNLGYYGIVQVINNTHTLVTAKYTDKISSAPHNQLTAFVFNFTGPLNYVYSQINGGTYSGTYKLKFGTDNYLKLPLTNAASSLSSRIQTIVSQLESGATTVPFNTTDPGAGP